MTNDLPDEVLEVLYRHQLGDLEPRVSQRLDQIFAHNPPDAVERLTRAARHLSITRRTALTERRINHAIATRVGDHP